MFCCGTWRGSWTIGWNLSACSHRVPPAIPVNALFVPSTVKVLLDWRSVEASQASEALMPCVATDTAPASLHVVDIYGPFGLGTFLRTALRLSYVVLPYRYRIHEAGHGTAWNPRLIFAFFLMVHCWAASCSPRRQHWVLTKHIFFVHKFWNDFT